METTCDIAIVGGGASGLAAAIAAARTASGAGRSVSVAVLEASERVGRSILKTGNGRCNFSNEHVADGRMLFDYHNAAFFREVLGTLCNQNAVSAGTEVEGLPDARIVGEQGGTRPDPVLDFFEGLGLEWRQEAEGRRYPLANKASVVLDVLRAEAARLGVKEACGCPVRAVEPPREEGALFTLCLEDGVFWRAKVVVVACGGEAIGRIELPSGASGGNGLEVDVAPLVALPASPVLGPLRCSDESCRLTRELDNIRVRCTVSLFRPQDASDSRELVLVRAEPGEMLFRAYGVSGICVFDLSRAAQPGDTLSIDLLDPLVPRIQARGYLERRRDQLLALYDSLDCARFLRGLVLPRVADVLLKYAGLQDGDALDDAALDSLESALTMLSLEVVGVGAPDQCQVRRGGLSVASFDPATMEACALPGLFACGEALDVDGPCGGYNLHWAWASGLVASMSAARAVR
ncbi:MAG: NAD(P)/FAD-dependent oxidoreductase [Eggerthellaceae bacterium]|nr:NAD(P)/FAD-dependent oxidoreductase [Eggerthellaceae bacterium]